MATLHFLNVKHGDCTWLNHENGFNTVIDVYNANKKRQGHIGALKGNFGQKDYPVNPIEYLKKFRVISVFRFILSHPDMDHMGGIKDFFDKFNPVTFWDTNNRKEMKKGFGGSPYNENDWNFYKNMRDNILKNPLRLTFLAIPNQQNFNYDMENNPMNGLNVLAPTRGLLEKANITGDFNDSSYVILYRHQNGRKVIFAGDSHDKTWDYILKNHASDVMDADLLIAPHHGRKSNRNYNFLNVVRPKLTFFGNAKHQHLAYNAWTNRGLEKITNNEGNCLIAKFDDAGISIYCTYETFAEAYCKKNGYTTFYDPSLDAYYLRAIL